MVIALIALFVSLGGTAAALSGSNTVFSDDIADDTFNSTEGQGGLVAADLRPNSVGASETASNSVGQSDIVTGGVSSSEIANSAVDADEIGEGVHLHTGTPVSVPGGGTPQNGSYDTGVASANCAAGEELISASAEWSGAFPQDGELWTAEVHLNTSTEGADVIGGNDSGTARSLVAVVACLEV
jgi:hypothetical protein